MSTRAELDPSQNEVRRKGSEFYSSQQCTLTVPGVPSIARQFSRSLLLVAPVRIIGRSASDHSFAMPSVGMPPMMFATAIWVASVNGDALAVSSIANSARLPLDRPRTSSLIEWKPPLTGVKPEVSGVPVTAPAVG